MNNPDIEVILRQELRMVNIRWQDCYRKLDDDARLRLIDSMRKRREDKMLIDLECLRKRLVAEPEDDPPDFDPEMAGVGNINFSHGTGGGRRVIKSTRGLS